MVSRVSYETLIHKQGESIGITTLNRPERRNALNKLLVRELSALLDDVTKDNDLKLVILTGGPKFFCAGVDLKEQSPTVMDELRGFLRKLHAFPRPTIAAVNGSCLAGGTQKLPRLIGVARAKEMHYTGEPITAREAHQFGLVNRVVPAASVLDESRRLASVTAQRSAPALKMAKFLIDAGMNMDLNRALEIEARTAQALLGSPEQLKSEMDKAAQQEDTYKKLFG